MSQTSNRHPAERRHEPLPAYRKRQIVAIIAAVLCAIGLGLAAHFQTQRNTENSQRLSRIANSLKTERQSAILGCLRLDTEIVQANRAELADYTLVKLSLALTRRNPSATKGGMAALRSAEAAQSWIEPTDCRETVRRSGTRYRLAPAVAFDRRLPNAQALKYPSFKGLGFAR